MIDVQAEKKAIIQRVEQIDDADLIQAVKSILDYGMRRNKDSVVGYQTNGKPITSLDFESNIVEAERDVEAGDFQTIEDLKKESENW
jgi:hypothetical protein